MAWKWEIYRLRQQHFHPSLLAEHPGIFNMAASMSRLLSGPWTPLMNVHLSRATQQILQRQVYQIPSKIQPIYRTSLSTVCRNAPIVFGRYHVANRQPFGIQLRQIVSRGSKKHFTAQNKKDGIPTDYILVYSAGLTNNMYYCNIILHVIAGLAVLLTVGNSYEHYRRNNKYNIFEPPVLTWILSGVVAMLFLFSCRGLARRTLLRIYYNETTDTFRAVCISGNSITHKVIKFTPQDVTQKDITGYMKHYFGNLMINGQAYTVEDRDFRSPHYYNHMMQWEKPKVEELDDHIDSIFGKRPPKDRT